MTDFFTLVFIFILKFWSKVCLFFLIFVRISTDRMNSPPIT